MRDPGRSGRVRVEREERGDRGNTAGHKCPERGVICCLAPLCLRAPDAQQKVVVDGGSWDAKLLTDGPVKYISARAKWLGVLSRIRTDFGTSPNRATCSAASFRPTSKASSRAKLHLRSGSARLAYQINIWTCLGGNLSGFNYLYKIYPRFCFSKFPTAHFTSFMSLPRDAHVQPCVPPSIWHPEDATVSQSWYRHAIDVKTLTCPPEDPWLSGTLLGR